MKVIHSFVLTDPAAAVRRSPATDQTWRLRCGGGGWRDIPGGICRDMERRSGRRCGDDVRGHDVPLAAKALADSNHARGVRARHPLRRMSWVSGVRAPSADVATSQEVWNSPKVSPHAWPESCGSSRETRRRWGYSILRYSDFRADRRARVDRACVASPARRRARARDVAARCDELRPIVPLGHVHPRGTQTDGVEASHRATTSQSRPARVSKSHRGPSGRARDLRRAAQSLVRTGVAES